MPDEPVMAEVDSRRVERILRNLVANALDHSESKPVKVTLRCSDAALAVSVRDHGVGMSAEEASRVFDRFWRADPSRDRTTGAAPIPETVNGDGTRRSSSAVRPPSAGA